MMDDVLKNADPSAVNSVSIRARSLRAADRKNRVAHFPTERTVICERQSAPFGYREQGIEPFVELEKRGLWR